MARSRTFADGEILTPADVNDHLVNHVPNPGDVYDTGWQTVPLAPDFSGQLRYRRVGIQVEMQYSVTSSTGLVPGATQINSTALPAEVRPPDNRRGGAALSGNYTGATGISASGVVFVIHQSGATREGASGSCVYFLG